MKLDDEQRAVVQHDLDGPHLVVFAGAGSGKTRCMAARVAHLLDQGVAPDAVAAIAFNKKAAAELATRIAGAHPSGRQVATSTFHSLGLRYLREWDIAQGELMTRGAALRQMRAVARERGLQGDMHAWLELVHELKGQGLARRAIRVELAARERAALEVFDALEKGKAQRREVEFIDMLWRFRELLADHDSARRYLAATLRYVLVDEVQDLNPLQLDLVARLGAAAQLMLIGDPKQSIYGFRGARPQALAEAVSKLGAKARALRRNYRSAEAIVDAADRLMQGSEAAAAVPAQVAVREERGHIQAVVLDDEAAEARWVVEAIAERLARGVQASDIGVLYRRNAQSIALELELAAAGLPTRVAGTRFHALPEVRDALAYLRLVHHADDEAAFWRAIASPTRYIGASIRARFARAHRKGRSCLKTLERCLPDLEPRERERALVALEDISRIAEMRASRPDAILSAVYALYDLAGRATFLEHQGRRSHDDDRLENLETLRRYAARFGSARLMLEAVAAARDARGPAVQLMTIHRAKGLEFERVVLVGCNTGLLPSGGPDDQDEERRLAYVAITRASRELLMTATRTRLGEPAAITPFWAMMRAR